MRHIMLQHSENFYFTTQALCLVAIAPTSDRMSRHDLATPYHALHDVNDIHSKIELGCTMFTTKEIV